MAGAGQARTAGNYPASFIGASPFGGNLLGLDGDRTYGSPIAQMIDGHVVGHRCAVAFD